MAVIDKQICGQTIQQDFDMPEDLQDQIKAFWQSNKPEKGSAGLLCTCIFAQNILRVKILDDYGASHMKRCLDHIKETTIQRTIPKR